ncbi:6093_t:CDS:2, partial [Diversispora eburnea]
VYITRQIEDQIVLEPDELVTSKVEVVKALISAEGIFIHQNIF